MKFENQFREVLEHSSKNQGNCFCFLIEKEKLAIIGVSEKVSFLHTALVIIRSNKQFYIKGSLDGINYESSTIEGFDASKNLVVGVDCRKKENNKLYFQADENLRKITSETLMDSDDAVILFFEHDNQASILICAPDPTQSETIREVVSSQSNTVKKFLRAIVYHNLQLNGINHRKEVESLEDNILPEKSEWYWKNSYE